MSTLVKLGIKLNTICVIGIIICAIAIYALNLGEWQIGKVQVFSIFVTLIFASLIISFLQDLIFKPSLCSQASQFAKQAVALTAEDDMSTGQVSFLNSVIDAINKRHKIRYISAAILGVVFYFSFGPLIGSPISEFITLIILWLGPTVISFLLQGSLTKMRMLNPELFESASQLYSQAFDVSFGH